MTETPKPSAADLVVEKAKNKQEIDLTQQELQELATSDTAEKAKVTLQTRDQLDHLVNELREERVKYGVENNEKNPNQGLAQQLETIEQQIDAHADTKPGGSVVIESPTIQEPKTLIDKVKNMFGGVGTSTISMLVRGWIGLQRMLIGVGLAQGSPQQLDAIEQLYGKWFGASEAIDKFNANLQGSGIEVVKDKKDAAAYTMIRREFNTALAARIGADKPNEQITRETFTMDAFIGEKAAEYAKTYALNGKQSRTTITGIMKNERPAEQATQPA